MRGNTILLKLAKRQVTQTGNLFQYDYGQRLVLSGVTLPGTYEVHFSNQEHGNSKTMLGDSTGVDIPDEYLLTGENIHVWVYLHDGESDGETEYHGIIGVTKRAKPTDQAPTPVQQSVIDQAIAALNAGVTEVEGIAEAMPGEIQEALAEAKASGEFDGFSPTATVSKSGDTATISITDKEGTTTAQVKDGAKGDPGTPGQDGFSPIATVTKSDDTATISITDKNGTTTATVKDGKDGTDGQDGHSPVVTASKSGKVTTVSVDGTAIATINDGNDGQDGQDGNPGATPVISIGTVSTLTPGSDATASMDTTDPAHPVLNLGIPEGEPGEVTEAELTAVAESKADIIHDTASGAIASITDGADGMPVDTLIVEVEPVQDLHGQESPYPAGGGKNKVDFKAALDYWGANYTDNGDGSITITNIGTGYSTPYRFSAEDGTFSISAESIVNGSTAYGWGIDFVNDNGNVTGIIRDNSLVSAGKTACKIRLNYGQSGNGVTIKKLQIESGSSATSYAPYSNICPITGWTGANVARTGVNLFDKTDVFDGYIDDADGILKGTNPYESTDYIRVVGGNSYCVISEQTSSMLGAWYDKNKNYISGATSYANQVITAPSNASFVRFTIKSSASGNVDTFAVNYPSTDHEYHIYHGEQIAYPFPSQAGTVYGGTLTVNKDGTGKLVVDRAMVDLGTLTFTKNDSSFIGVPCFYATIPSVKAGATYVACSDYTIKRMRNNINGTGQISPGNNIDATYCVIRDDRYATGDAESFKTAMSGVQLVYELSTPVTYNLTELEVISMLKGNNNIWADTGETSIDYPVDTKLYIDKHLSASQTLMELIVTANREEAMKATKAYTTGNLIIVNGTLYRATTSIANGANLTVGTNVTATTVGAEIAALHT